MAFNIENMASGWCKEKRKTARVGRERLMIASNRTDDRPACRICEIDVKDVLGAEILAAPQTAGKDMLSGPHRTNRHRRDRFGANAERQRRADRPPHANRQFGAEKLD